MRTTRIFVDQALTADADLILDARAARHVSQVLRLRAGQWLTLFNGDGRDLQAQIVDCRKQHCGVRVGDVVRVEAEAALTVHLGIGISRGERMDYAIQKAVELGVGAITPLMTERSMVQLKADRLAQRISHWRGVVIAACEQSGRALLPQLHPPAPLAQWTETQTPGLLLHHRADATLATLPPPKSPLNLMVGPEGGLSDMERELAMARGFAAVRLGPRVLRTETAPLAALAAIQALWGDFR